MPNRMIMEYNQLIAESKYLSEFYSRSYLNGNQSIQSGVINYNTSVIGSIDFYYQLEGYRIFGTSEENKSKLTDLSRLLLGVTRDSRNPICFTVYGNGNETKVFYGVNHTDKDAAYRLLSTCLSNVTIGNKWLTLREQQDVQQFNGFVSGISSLNSVDLDSFIDEMKENQYMLNMILYPVERSALESELNEIQRYIAQLGQVTNVERTIGNSQPRRFATVNPDVVECVDTLTKESERLQRAKLNGGWRVLIHYSSADNMVFTDMGRLLSSTFNNRMDMERHVTGTCTIPVNYICLDRSKWYYPEMYLGTRSYGGLYHNSIANILDLDTSMCLVQPPVRSHHNYTVHRIGDPTGNPFKQFRQEDGRDMPLGRLSNGNTFKISKKDLIQHVFITGTTGYGKSTTAMAILNQIQKKGVPFVVLESEKKEYWKLLRNDAMKDLRIYSYGQDAVPLYLNPFEPEPGTMISFHVNGLINALLSVFDTEDPLPQILRKLITTCYEKKGWDLSARYNGNAHHEWPRLSDLLDNLEECVQEIGYDEEVKNNMQGVVRIRVTSLIQMLGDYFNSASNTPVEELFRYSTIIELDDVSYEEKPFVASLIALKIHEYVRNQGDERELKRMLVIEEAHNILANTDNLAVSHSSRLCSEYFDHMISVSSGLGLGVMTIDLRPSRVNQGVLANSGMKIVHTLSNDEVNSMVKALHLDQRGEESLMKQNIGEAIIKCPSDPDIYQVSINRLREERSCTTGCLFCEHRQCDDRIMNLVSDYERSYVANHGFTTESLNACFKFIELRNHVELTCDEKMCIGGLLGQGEKMHRQRQALYGLFQQERSVNQRG